MDIDERVSDALHDAYQLGLEFSARAQAVTDAWDGFRRENDLDGLFGFEDVCHAIEALRGDHASTRVVPQTLELGDDDPVS
jgi:ribulose bisphosphate carboxylase small subunit